MSKFHLYLAGSRTGVVRATDEEAAANVYGLRVTDEGDLVNRYGAPAGRIEQVS